MVSKHIQLEETLSDVQKTKPLEDFLARLSKDPALIIKPFQALESSPLFSPNLIRYSAIHTTLLWLSGYPQISYLPVNIILEPPTEFPRILKLEITFRFKPEGRELIDKAEKLRQDFKQAMTSNEMYEVAENKAHLMGSLLRKHLNVCYKEQEAGFKRVYRWF